MPSRTHIAFLLSLSLCLVGVSCRKTHVYPQMDSNALMQLVRAYDPNKHAGQVAQAAQVPAAAVQPAVQAAVAPQKLPTQLEYASPIKQAFSQGKFDELERIIREARETKGRIVGGNWKIIEFYTDVYETFLTPTSPESDWKMFFDTLNQWIAAKPESAAARISLAQAYVGYAWQARGHGYANTVSDDAWDLFNERIAMAAATLADAARLKEKCPYWYETMQTVALAQGWDKSLARELMEDAVAYEPDYYHFYREHANFLQTKWYGEEGEVESFAAEVADRMGGAKGDILYFEITSLVACQCDANDDALQNMSWPRIKQGYTALGQLYGVSSIKRNRFASMAVKAKDRGAAHEVLAEIGPDWDKDVWVTNEKFEYAKNWATTE